MNPAPETIDRVERIAGSRPVGWTFRRGGYSMAGRWSMELADGRRVFAKLGTSDVTGAFLRDEHRNMAAIDADFRCEIVGFEDGTHPLLVLEDLGHGRWPPPWGAGDVERVLEVLGRVWSSPVPSHLPNAESKRVTFSGWGRVATDPSGFLSLGLCSASWLERALPELVAAERRAELDGDDLVHLDVRSDNTCFVGDRVVLVDWNWACRGSRRFDLAAWLGSLRLEGGPLPEDIAPGLGAEAAMLAGYFAWNAPLAAPPDAPTVRRFQLRQLRVVLPWVCRQLGLPEPDLPWATREIGPLSADVEAGRITESEWHARVEETLADAYLACAEPWRQSGKGGDETDWRWSRELVLDVVVDGDAVLDVGCANGYLMESLHRWGAERGIRVEPYGVDISWRLVSLARRRLPHWADRIFEANVMSWTPPRRFDVVHTGLDYMPLGRRRDHAERVLRDFLVPGGRMVLRAARMPAGPDPAAELGEIGFRPDGVLEAVHPTSGEVRRTAYVTAR